MIHGREFRPPPHIIPKSSRVKSVCLALPSALIVETPLVHLTVTEERSRADGLVSTAARRWSGYKKTCGAPAAGTVGFFFFTFFRFRFFASVEVACFQKKSTSLGSAKPTISVNTAERTCLLGSVRETPCIRVGFVVGYLGAMAEAFLGFIERRSFFHVCVVLQINCEGYGGCSAYGTYVDPQLTLALVRRRFGHVSFS